MLLIFNLSSFCLFEVSNQKASCLLFDFKKLVTKILKLIPYLPNFQKVEILNACNLITDI